MYLLVKSTIELKDHRNVLGFLEPKTYEIDCVQLSKDRSTYSLNLYLFGSNHPKYSCTIYLPKQLFFRDLFIVDSIASELLSQFYNPN